MKKLLFLVAVSEKVHDEGIKFPEESEYRYENSFHLAIRSGDYEYVDTVISGKSKLQRKYAPSTDVPSAVGGYDTIFEMETAYARSISTSNTHNSSSSEKCYWCNGTGSVRYNYGSSDLEAILSGHDPYTYGTCASCGGTGKAK